MKPHGLKKWCAFTIARIISRKPIRWALVTATWPLTFALGLLHLLGIWSTPYRRLIEWSHTEHYADGSKTVVE